ncbi:MAG: geranylgeranyl reductase family protein [Vulcanimicrobiaceae bacterium]
MKRVDVAVVGGGPAGAAAAHALARAGRSVVVFERARVPRDKVCGDLLGTDAVALVRRLGFPPSVLDGAMRLDGAVLHGVTGDSYGAVPSTARRARVRAVAADAACVLRRPTLDAALLCAAERAGATVRFERVAGVVRAGDRIVGVRTAREEIAARLVIGADGWGSVVARDTKAFADAGVRVANGGGVAIAVRAYARGLPSLEKRMHFFVNAPGDGYGWIFPLEGDAANVGLGYIRGEDDLDIAAAWRRFVRPGSHAYPYLHGATVGTPQAWPIPLGPQFPVPERGTFLTGDAARLASPLSGSGIANALASGAAAARFSLRALAGDESTWDAYVRWLRVRVGLRLQAEAWMHATCATPATVDRYARLTRLPGGGALLSRAMLALG